MIFNSSSIDDTHHFAQMLAEKIMVGSVVSLTGNLGTGKTTFTQGFAKAIGINERVGSPTFKLVSEYEGKDHWLYHIDAYRLEGGIDFLKIGGEEYLRPEKGFTLIEWADLIADVLDDNIISVNLSRIKDNSNARRIDIKGIDINV